MRGGGEQPLRSSSPSSCRLRVPAMLDGPEGRHAATVRRLRAGESLGAHRRRGRLAPCDVAEVAVGTAGAPGAASGDQSRPGPAGRRWCRRWPRVERGELAVELATEAGVDAIVPWRAARCVARWETGPRGARALARWRRRPRGGQAVPPGDGGRSCRAGGIAACSGRLAPRPGAWCCTRARPIRWSRSRCPPRENCCWSSGPKAASPRPRWPRSLPREAGRCG